MTDDELDSLVASADDIVDGLEAFQVLHADPFIEAHVRLTCVTCATA